MDINYKYIKQIMSQVIDYRVKKGIKDFVANSTRYYPAKVLNVSTDGLKADVQMVDKDNTTYEEMVNKTGVILHKDDEVKIMAPDGDLTDGYIGLNKFGFLMDGGNIADFTIHADKIDLEANTSFQAKVGKGEIISAINMTPESITISSNKIDLESSSIIQAKVDKNGIISSINMSPENIVISSNRIDLEGYVTFTNLNTPGQTTISGSNITVGGGGGTIQILDANNNVCAELTTGGYHGRTVYFNTSFPGDGSCYIERGQDNTMSIYNQVGDIILEALSHNIIFECANVLIGQYSIPKTNTDSSGINVLRMSGSDLLLITNGGSQYTISASASDARLKTNIVNSSEDYLGTINNVNVVQYDWIRDNKHVKAGVTTQQLQTLNEDFAHVFVKKDGVEYYAPDWDKVLPYIIGSVQQEDSKVEELKSKIISLENEIEMLKTQIVK